MVSVIILPQGWRQRSKGPVSKKVSPVLCRWLAATEYIVIIIIIIAVVEGVIIIISTPSSSYSSLLYIHQDYLKRHLLFMDQLHSNVVGGVERQVGTEDVKQVGWDRGLAYCTPQPKSQIQNLKKKKVKSFC